jgi:hypothetical protein
MIGDTKNSTATPAAQKAAVLVASYTSQCTARAVLADKSAAVRAVTEARQSLERRGKELDHAIQLLSAHHTANL